VTVETESKQARSSPGSRRRPR